VINKSEYTVIYRGKSIEVHQVKNLLETYRIDCFTKNDMLGQLFPLFGGHGAIDPVKLYVRKSEFQRANRIISDYFDADPTR